MNRCKFLFRAALAVFVASSVAEQSEALPGENPSLVEEAFHGTARRDAVPSLAKPRPVEEVFHGTTVVDPFRHLEAFETDPEIQGWFKSQADHARSVLDGISERSELLRRITELSNSATAQVISLRVLPSGMFYLKRNEGEDQFKLYWLPEGGTERLIFDPEAAGPEELEAINYYEPSPDARFVAIGSSRLGSELATIRVREVATGLDTGVEIDRARFGGVAWLDDESGFFHIRSPLHSEGAPETGRYQNLELHFHKLGTDPEEDAVVLGAKVPGTTGMLATHIPYVHLRYGDPRVFVAIVDGVRREFAFFVATRAAVAEGKPEWRKLFGFEDQIRHFDVRGDDLYVVSVKDAPRGKLLRMSVSDPNPGEAEVIIPPGTAVVETVSAARDALYITLLDGGRNRIQRLPLTEDGKLEELKPPIDGRIGTSVNSRMDGAVLFLNSWSKGERICRYDPATGAITDMGLQPADPLEDSLELEVREVHVESHDGVSVPLSVIYRRGLALDGRNPCWLTAYGSYGFNAPSRRFDPTMIAWYERGGIYAVAHVRGGGAYGEEWHRAGQKTTKPNTWKDLIACAEWLVKERYTSPGALAVSGRSAGGITVGRAITERPDLFRAALGEVGTFDMLRCEFSANGVANIPEFGTVLDETEFHALAEMDSCRHVVDGQRYPAVLLTAGYHDVRVPAWQPGKFAASLQAAGASPVLLRVDYGAGHGAGVTRSQRNELLADEMAFFFAQMRETPPADASDSDSPGQ